MARTKGEYLRVDRAAQRHERMILNKREMLSPKQCARTEKHPNPEEKYVVNGEWLASFWEEMGALMHDPDIHVMTRTDGSRIMGTTPEDIQTISCKACSCMVADIEPWAASGMFYTRNRVTVYKTTAMCSACWIGPIVHQGSDLTEEQQAENEAAYQEWLSTLPAEVLEYRKPNEQAILEHRTVGINDRVGVRAKARWEKVKAAQERAKRNQPQE